MAKGHVSEAYKEMAEHSGMLLYIWVRQYIHRGIEILSGEVSILLGKTKIKLKSKSVPSGRNLLSVSSWVFSYNYLN